MSLRRHHLNVNLLFARASLRIDDLGFAWLPQDSVVKYFAPDVDEVDANVIYAVQ